MKTIRPSGRFLCVVALLTLVSVSPASARIFLTPDFGSPETRPKSLALLPPHAEFIKAKVVMTEEMVKECEALENAARDQIRMLLSEKGYSVRLLSVEEINAAPDLQEVVLRLNERYDEEWGRIIRKPRKVRSGRYQLGEEARRIAALLGVDGIIIPRIQAIGVSGGVKALSILAGGYAQGFARLDLSVVNGSSGDVEAYMFSSQPAGMKGLTKKADKVMGRVARKALRKYPDSTQTVNVRVSGLEEEAAEEEEEKDEEVILQELEGLLGEEEP